MSDPVSTRCPACQAKLKLKSSAAIGKKVTCPKCQKPFVAEALAAPTSAAGQDDDFLDDLGDYDDDYSGESLPPLPRKKSSSGKSSKSSKKKQPASPWKHPGVIIGSSVVGLLLIVGIVLFASGVFSSDEPEGKNGQPEVTADDSKQKNDSKQKKSSPKAKKTAAKSGNRQLDLAYLPADAELLISVDANAVWNSSLVQSLIQNPQAQAGIDQMKQEIGLGPEDIQSVMVGVADLEKQKNLASGPNMMLAPGNSPARVLSQARYSVVVRTKTQIDQQKFRASLDEIQNVTHAGKTYHVKTVDNQSDSAFYFPDTKTVVITDEPSMKGIIDGNGKSTPRTDLAFLDTSQQILLAVVPKDPSLFNTDEEGSSQDQSADPMEQAMKKLTAGSLGVTLADGVDFQLQGNFADAASAKAFSTALKAQTQEGLTQLAEAKKNFQQPEIQEVLTLFEDMLKGMNETEQGKLVRLSVSVPGSKTPTLAKAPGALMGMAFMSAMQGGGGPIGTPDSSTFTPPPAGNANKPAEPIKAVDLAEFNESWQTDVNVSNQPAEVALKKLAGEMRLGLETPNSLAAALKKPVTVNLQQKSRLEAVEEICRQIGLHPKYEQQRNYNDGKTTTTEIIKLEPEPRPYPVQFAGPFLVAVTDIRENAPNPTGAVRLQFVATNLPGSVVQRLKGGFQSPAAIETVEGSGGEEILDVEQPMMSSGISDEAVNLNLSATVPLKNLLRSVTAIKTVSGKIQFGVPTEIQTLKFDKLENGASQKGGTVTMTLKRANLRDQFSSIQFEITGVGDDFSYRDVVFEPLDAEEKLLKVMGHSSYGSRGKHNVDFQIEGKADSVTARVITQSSELDYDFAFSDLPLKSFSEMPEKIEPAKFAGHDAPLTLEFVKITGEENFRKVQFKAVNHADKDIENMQMTLVFLDGAGKKLKDFPSSFQGQGRFVQRGSQEGRFVQDPAVGKNASTQIEVAAFFMPEETKTVKAELKKIRFVDAEVWKGEGAK